ncbi:hypothetical protein Z517_01301 [Fonsecaea pedrosoi CBS 271.37]|uniref:ADA HAT complex component 1 n=1 Tax=Fonsecaea pedrosoi CBS 271.37 TaxID=1442368 RepID=A0A0D2GXV5_9EURO|nr:uncharacterized protein Z517_01301 [Fonsecaea pedrosoi CBS 271.37]KIW85908.1 hypothetical protein Z517_01301 [Fonsecaea pedrosoi CBS 271.37]
MSQMLPTPSAIPLAAFREALRLYPSLVEKVYRSKLKNDNKKVTEALKRDRWRFHDLPAAVAAAAAAEPVSGGADVDGEVASASKKDKSKTKQAKTKKNGSSGTQGGGGGGGLTKDDVERLVQWKITHGHSRPFLPAMVRKNDASAVQAQTCLAFAKLSSSSTSESTSGSFPQPSRLSTAVITDALDAVCKLTGIGPATGTLILNVFDPVHVPFFQDEMYLWFFPTADKKLKYSLKEYTALLEAAGPVLERLNVTARELEQVAYVLGHVDLLEGVERKGLLDAFDEHPGLDEAGVRGEGEGEGEGDGKDDDDNAKDNSPQQPQPQPQPQQPTPAQKGRKRTALPKDEDNKEETRAPKRRSQRQR